MTQWKVFHDRIEDEFYDIEIFNSLSEFLSKAWTFILYWNLNRENLETKKSPFRLIKEKCHIFDPNIANFQPFILDEIKPYRYLITYKKMSPMLPPTSQSQTRSGFSKKNIDSNFRLN
jgi:hypothetical protein